MLKKRGGCFLAHPPLDVVFVASPTNTLDRVYANNVAHCYTPVNQGISLTTPGYYENLRLTGHPRLGVVVVRDGSCLVANKPLALVSK